MGCFSLPEALKSASSGWRFRSTVLAAPLEGVFNMKARHIFAAGAALLGAAMLASPALAIEQIHIPDSSAAQSSGTPDALFDKSIPATWQKKTDGGDQMNAKSPFHVYFSGGSGYGQQTDSQTFGEDAKKPGSEFHQNGVPLQGPLLFPQY